MYRIYTCTEYIYLPLASCRPSVTGTFYCSTFCDFILDEFSKSYFATLVEQDDINSFELVLMNSWKGYLLEVISLSYDSCVPL